MKKTALLFASLVMTSICFAQVNYTIPMDSTSAWRIWHSAWDGTGGGTWTHEGRVFVSGDTTINNLIYNRLSICGISIYSFQGHTSTSNFSNPNYALIRSDDTRTYMLFDNEEFLLYDFSLQAGDHLPQTLISENTAIVSSIDTVIVNGKSLKRFNIYDPENSGLLSNWYIEGIGHEYGIIEPMYMMLDNGTGFECYAENGVAVFPEGNDCDLTVAITQVQKPETTMDIYPNPTNGFIILNYTSNTVKEVEVQISGARGEIITSNTWKVQPGQNEQTFNLKSLSPGLYIAIIRNGVSVANRKFIVQP